jgi:starvation-inducible DNA-binding protein
MDGLIGVMKLAFADTFAMYLRAHYYHWNVEGPDFYQYHGLFEAIYSEVYGAIDPMAEEIRSIKAYAPGSLGRLKELSTVEDDDTVPTGLEMVAQLRMVNETVLTSLQIAYKACGETELGLANFLQDRINAHKKHAWMLRATLEGR